MAAVKPQLQRVDVDMVPLIDVIQLLLMFLVIVGDMAASATNIPMKLPRASEAKTERELHVRTEGRMVVQLRPVKESSQYQAVINNKSYDLAAMGGSKSLLEYLSEQVDFAVAKGYATKDSQGAVSSPVKLRIPDDCPMFEVERVIMSLSRVGLVNVQYAAEPLFNK